ncbi:MAG: hypothetical protein ACPGKT_02190 [Hyphomicrobiales bacterium]
MSKKLSSLILIIIIGLAIYFNNAVKPNNDFNSNEASVTEINIQ